MESGFPRGKLRFPLGRSQAQQRSKRAINHATKKPGTKGNGNHIAGSCQLLPLMTLTLLFSTAVFGGGGGGGGGGKENTSVSRRLR